MLFVRPGNLVHHFTVEPKTQFTDSRGRVRDFYDAEAETGTVIIGVLAQSTPAEQERWRQMQHNITHSIVQYGKPKAKAEDRLKLGKRTFYIQGIDEVDELGIATIYYVEERADTNANND